MSFGISRGKTLDTGDIGIEMRSLPSSDGSPIDPSEWFPDPSRQLEIEIGSGKGTFLLQEAKQRQEVNFLGFEWAGEFYRYSADRIRRSGLTNVRIIYGDATQFLQYWCQDQVAQVVHLYFSDPWPKKRHHKRRVIQDESLRTVHRILQSKGEIKIVTDHDGLWNWYEEHFARNADLFSTRLFDETCSAESGELVGTNFERKYRKEGRPFHAVTLIRNDLCIVKG